MAPHGKYAQTPPTQPVEGFGQSAEPLQLRAHHFAEPEGVWVHASGHAQSAELLQMKSSVWVVGKPLKQPPEPAA
jgi:hypothetical protein